MSNKLVAYLKRITRMSFLTWMQYPYDVFATGVGTLAYTFMQLVFFYFLFSSGKGILGGYTYEQFYLVFYISQWATTLFFLLSWKNLQQLGKKIEQGDIDLSLTKPIWETLILQLPSLVVSSTAPLIFIQAILALLFFVVGLPAVPFYFFPFALLLILLGWFLIHTLTLMSITMLFFFKGFWGLYRFSGNFSDMMQYPKDIFPKPLQVLFSYLVPYFLISDPIYRIFQHSLTTEYLLEFFLYYILYTGAVWSLWRYGLRKYDGG